jgi:hypothetical protein
MSVIALAAAVELVVLHMVDGRIVHVNPREVTQLVQPREAGENKQLPDEVECLIRFTDGTYLSVVEDCDKVRRAFEGEQP